jgi:hypothetical protein
MATKPKTPKATTPAAPQPDVSQTTLNQLLAPFMSSLQGDAKSATTTQNPSLAQMFGNLNPSYQSAIAPYMSQYNANVQSLPALIQGSVQDVGKAAMLSDLLNALRYQFVYGGQNPSQGIGQFSGVLKYLLGENAPSSGSTSSTGQIPLNLGPIIDQSSGGNKTPSF